jgi:hypothetical protein
MFIKGRLSVNISEHRTAATWQDGRGSLTHRSGSLEPQNVTKKKTRNLTTQKRTENGHGNALVFKFK